MLGLNQGVKLGSSASYPIRIKEYFDYTTHLSMQLGYPSYARSASQQVSPSQR